MLISFFKFEKIVCVYLARILGLKKMNFEVSKVEPEREKTLFQTVSNTTIPDTNENSLMLKRLGNIEKTLINIWNDMNEKQIEEVKEIKWKYAAIVMDRLFLYLTTIYFVLTFCPFVLSIKNFYKPT